MKSVKSNLIFLIYLFSFAATSGQTPDSLLNLDKKDKQKQTVIPTKDNYLLVYDGLYDMTGSAQNLITASHLFGRGLDEITCKHDPKTGFNFCMDKDSYFGRAFIGFMHLWIMDLCSSIQHECMGHGYRGREFDARIDGYKISFTLGISRVDLHYEDMTYYEKLITHMGGCESSTVLAREAFRQSLLNDYFYHYYYFSFNMKLIDEPLYILIATPKVDSHEWNVYTGGGWDIRDYIKLFAAKSNESEKEIYKSAQKGAYWSLADPSLLISLFNYTYYYIIQGKSQVKSPMIKINAISFLPFTDFHLSPYGFEYYIGNYFKYNKTLYETYYRWSNGNIDGKSFGFGLTISNFIKYKNLRIDAGFDLWKQNFNLLYYNKDDIRYQQGIFSGKVLLKTHYQLNNTLSLWTQLSYKGIGFLLGYPIQKGFNAKIGMGFFF